VRTEHE